MWEEIISGAGALINSGLNLIGGQQQSKSLMRYQSQLNQEAIDRQNRYNSPIAQMQRLEEAGLNPNLVYGNGVEGNQSSAPNVGIANRNPQLDSGLLDAVNTYFKRQQIQNENRLTEANEQKILADKMLSQARYLDLMQDVARKDATFDTYVQKAAADLEHTRQSIEESKTRAELNRQKKSNLIGEAYKVQSEIRLLEAKEQTELLQPDYIRAKINEAISRAYLNESQMAVADSIVRLNDKKIEQLVELIAGLKLDNGEKAINYELLSGMQGMGLNGFKPKDLLELLKFLIQGLVK